MASVSDTTVSQKFILDYTGVKLDDRGDKKAQFVEEIPGKLRLALPVGCAPTG